MTFAELRTDVFRRLEASEASPVFWTVDDVDAALNDGLMELSDETEWFEIWRSIDLCADRPYYDVRTIFSDVEVLTPGRAFHEDTNRWMESNSPRDLDGHYRQWARVGGQPQQMHTRGLWWLGYWPISALESGTVKQYATALPDPLDEDTDEPGFEAAFHDALVEYALAVLWPQAGEVTKAFTAWQAYIGYETALAASVHDRGTVPQWHGYR